MASINCYFTGRAGRKLFTVYEPPSASGRGERAVVLCYPPGVDYFNSHRSFVKLSGLLCESGAHVLRFDWYGTGDSGGHSAEADVNGWLQDLSVAIEELKAVSALSRVWLIGLRFGAALALMGARDRSDIAGIILWDPIVDGSRHVRESLPRHLTIEHGKPMVRGLKRRNGSAPAVAIITKRLQEEFESIDTAQLLSGKLPRLILVVSDDLEAYRGLREQLQQRSIDYDYEVIASAQAWVESRDQWAGEIPLELLQRLTHWVR